MYLHFWMHALLVNMWALLCVYTCLYMYMCEAPGKHITKIYKSAMLWCWSLYHYLMPRVACMCTVAHACTVICKSSEMAVLGCNGLRCVIKIVLSLHYRMGCTDACYLCLMVQHSLWSCCALTLLCLGRDLYYNQISTLPADVFENCTSLSILWVGMCWGMMHSLGIT